MSTPNLPRPDDPNGSGPESDHSPELAGEKHKTGDRVDVDQSALTLDGEFDFSRLEPTVEGLGRLGSYQLKRVLGYGGMGVVFEGYDTQLRRDVAIKVLSRRLSHSPIARRRFIREARAAAGIGHDNVVTIHAVEEKGPEPFIVMQLVRGESLRDRIRREGRIDSLETLRLAAQISAGLAAAHAQGVIHRDIKPGNILLDAGLGRAILVDFGLARATTDNVDLTDDGIIVGTPGYMSPEQVLGQTIDARSDLFSLGCVIYAMLTGTSPFQGATYLDTSRRVTDNEPLPLQKFDEKIPAFLSDLVDRLLRKDPEKRPQSAAEVANLLSRYMAMANQAPSDRLPMLLHEVAEKKSPTRQAWRSIAWPRIATWPRIVGLVLPLLVVFLLSGWWFTRPTELSVALDGSGRYTSLEAALENCRPKGVIRVIQPGLYTGIFKLYGPEHDGVVIEGVPGVILAAPEREREVLEIRDSRDVTVRGLEFAPKASQIGLALAGHCEGCLIENITVQQTFDAKWASVYLHHGASGTLKKPIRMRGLDLRCGAVGLVIGEDDAPIDARPVQWVDVSRSRIRGHSSETGVLLVLMSNLRSVAITDNVFDRGLTGIGLTFRSDKEARAVSVTGNTFHEVKSFLFADMEKSDQDLHIQGNALLRVESIDHPDSNQTLPPTIRDNQWERPGSMPQVDSPIANIVETIPLRSRDPQSADYLRLPMAEGEP